MADHSSSWSRNARRRMPTAVSVFVVAATFGLLFSSPAEPTAPQPRALRDRAYELAYNLDYPEAMATMREAAASAPDDASIQRGLAAIAWLEILFRRGSVLVDNYLGQVTKPSVELAKPPADLAALFRETSNRALTLAEARLRANPNDISAHYEAGAAVGLVASYTASVEGSIFGAFRAARRAFNE